MEQSLFARWFMLLLYPPTSDPISGEVNSYRKEVVTARVIYRGAITRCHCDYRAVTYVPAVPDDRRTHRGSKGAP